MNAAVDHFRNVEHLRVPPHATEAEQAVLAGLMLPSAIILLQLLLNDRELLGRLANKSWNNWLNWTIIAVLVVLSGILAVQVLLPAIFPAG